jgi:uncharacterized protein YjiS (DUF1127 family)
MADTITATPIRASENPFARIGAHARSLVDAWRRAAAYRNTYSQLSALSDRELDDLGLTRGELHRRAYDAVYLR